MKDLELLKVTDESVSTVNCEFPTSHPPKLKYMRIHREGTKVEVKAEIYVHSPPDRD
jgi:hypothetical protein